MVKAWKPENVAAVKRFISATAKKKAHAAAFDDVVSHVLERVLTKFAPDSWGEQKPQIQRWTEDKAKALRRTEDRHSGKAREWVPRPVKDAARLGSSFDLGRRDKVMLSGAETSDSDEEALWRLRCFLDYAERRMRAGTVRGETLARMHSAHERVFGFGAEDWMNVLQVKQLEQFLAGRSPTMDRLLNAVLNVVQTADSSSTVSQLRSAMLEETAMALKELVCEQAAARARIESMFSKEALELMKAQSTTARGGGKGIRGNVTRRNTATIAAMAILRTDKSAAAEQLIKKATQLDQDVHGPMRDRSLWK